MPQEQNSSKSPSPGAKTRALVGLGNPGLGYARSRHNAGARVVGLLWRKYCRGKGIRKKYVLYRVEEVSGLAVFVARVRSYMNESGEPVKRFLEEVGVEAKDLLVIHDDLDLPPGTLRFRRGGSSGGHKGVQSIIEALATDGFARLKIGIGRPGGKEREVVDFVLSPPSGREKEILKKTEAVAAEAAWLWVKEGIDYCMNRFNRSVICAEEGKC